MTTTPDLSQPLVQEPSQSDPGPNPNLGPLAILVGTWTNQNILDVKAHGETDPYPYSYNVMPLPQSQGSPGNAGYILKNFKYYEEITFSAIHGNAPNRGGSFTQTSQPLFYEQRVYLAEGPDQNRLIHAENGSWLYLQYGPQILGPYGMGGQIPYSGQQEPEYPIVKQISVPHGNSVLARGYYQQSSGAITALGGGSGSIIPQAQGLDTSQYSVRSVGNPHPELNNAFPQQLELFVRDLSISKGDVQVQVTTFGVDTQNQGQVVNINFESNHAQVKRYHAVHTIVSTETWAYMFYAQQIDLILQIPGVGAVDFPHVTCNVVKKVS